MLKREFTCRTCGKVYKACPDCERNGSWRAVACSPECYVAYVDAVTTARDAEAKLMPIDTVEPVVEEVLVESELYQVNENDRIKTDNDEVEPLTKSKRK